MYVDLSQIFFNLQKYLDTQTNIGVPLLHIYIVRDSPCSEEFVTEVQTKIITEKRHDMPKVT